VSLIIVSPTLKIPHNGTEWRLLVLLSRVEFTSALSSTHGERQIGQTTAQSPDSPIRSGLDEIGWIHADVPSYTPNVHSVGTAAGLKLGMLSRARH